MNGKYIGLFFIAFVMLFICIVGAIFQTVFNHTSPSGWLVAGGIMAAAMFVLGR